MGRWITRFLYLLLWKMDKTQTSMQCKYSLLRLCIHLSQFWHSLCSFLCFIDYIFLHNGDLFKTMTCINSVSVTVWEFHPPSFGSELKTNEKIRGGGDSHVLCNRSDVSELLRCHAQHNRVLHCVSLQTICKSIKMKYSDIPKPSVALSPKTVFWLKTSIFQTSHKYILSLPKKRLKSFLNNCPL